MSEPFEVDGRKLAYVAVAVDNRIDGDHMIAVCVEDDDGYRPILDYGSGTKERMTALALQMNKDRGVTEAEAFRIVGTTMFKKKTRR